MSLSWYMGVSQLKTLQVILFNSEKRGVKDAHLSFFLKTHI